MICFREKYSTSVYPETLVQNFIKEVLRLSIDMFIKTNIKMSENELFLYQILFHKFQTKLVEIFGTKTFNYFILPKLKTMMHLYCTRIEDTLYL